MAGECFPAARQFPVWGQLLLVIVVRSSAGKNDASLVLMYRCLPNRQVYLGVIHNSLGTIDSFVRRVHVILWVICGRLGLIKVCDQETQTDE